MSNHGGGRASEPIARGESERLMFLLICAALVIPLVKRLGV